MRALWRAARAARVAALLAALLAATAAAAAAAAGSTDADTVVAYVRDTPAARNEGLLWLERLAEVYGPDPPQAGGSPAVRDADGNAVDSRGPRASTGLRVDGAYPLVTRLVVVAQPPEQQEQEQATPPSRGFGGHHQDTAALAPGLLFGHAAEALAAAAAQLPALRLFPRQAPDLACLLSPPPQPGAGVPLPLPVDDDAVAEAVRTINRHCQRHREPSGALTPAGVRKQQLLDALYRVPPPSSEPAAGQPPQCDEVDGAVDPDVFLRDYVYRSRPAVFRGAVRHWRALQAWTNDFLRAELSHRTVHIKLTPDGQFEGCEPAARWPGYAERRMPDVVRQQLSAPDLVVVRPAPLDTTFGAFMDLLYSGRNVSAYLEYASIASHLPRLLEDLEAPAMAAALTQEHLNIWLGNGRTVGKLHFDPFDNLLCQVSGAKHLLLFEPYNNSNLYEGHIAEAELSYNRHTGEFRRDTLLQSTSMVMSPVDLARPDLVRFPRFAHARALSCEIRAGDVLFLPSFWWHEVRSKPDAHHRNIAVNYWYTPFYDKEFPCASCPLHVSPHYTHLLAV